MKQFYIVNKNGFFNLYSLWLLSFLLLCATVLSEKVATLQAYQHTMANELIHLFIVQHVNQTLQTLYVEHKGDEQSPSEDSETESKNVYPLEETVFYQGVSIMLSYHHEVVNGVFVNGNRECQFQIHYEMEQYFIMGIEYITNMCNI